MRPDQVLLLTVVALLTTTGVLSATVKTRQIKSLSNNHKAPIRHEGYVGRSLRLAKKDDGATDEEGLIDTEERANFISSIVSKISEKTPISLKLTLWEAIGKSPEKVKKKLGLENVKGSALATHDNFPYYLKYADRIEKHDMSKKVEGSFSTYSFWEKMEDGVGKINTAKELNSIQHTNAFRKYKRYANIFDDNMISTMDSGYHTPKVFDDAATPIEKQVRAAIWGESKRDNSHVKEWLGLERATPEELNSNKYYQQYLTAFKGTKKPAKDAEIAALRKVLLAQ